MTTLQRRVSQVGAVAVVALACYAEALSASRTWSSVLDEIVDGSAFGPDGLIAWWLRSGNRVGLLMIGVGVGLLTVDVALQDRVGLVWQPARVLLILVSPLWAVVLIHLLLAFPGGRLVSRLDRVVVRSFYAVVPLAAILAGVAGHQVLGRISQPVFDIEVPAAGDIYAACLVIGSALVIRRWFLGGRARRRSMSPVFWPMVPITILFLIATAAVLGRSLTVPATVFPLFLVALPIGILIGLLRSGLDMSSVGDLVVKLSGGLAPEQLQPPLAPALNDPSLEVAYWLPAQEWVADLEGRRIEVPTGGSERTGSVLGASMSP